VLVAAATDAPIVQRLARAPGGSKILWSTRFFYLHLCAHRYLSDYFAINTLRGSLGWPLFLHIFFILFGSSTAAKEAAATHKFPVS